MKLEKPTAARDDPLKTTIFHRNFHHLPGYLLHYKQAPETDWHTVELSPEVTSYTMDMLKCGSTYNAKIQAKNKISIGPPSDVLTATTRGGREYLWIGEQVI